jgi:hypothetical protein
MHYKDDKFCNDTETKIRWHKSLCSCIVKGHTFYCEIVRGTDVEK